MLEVKEEGDARGMRGRVEEEAERHCWEPSGIPVGKKEARWVGGWVGGGAT